MRKENVLYADRKMLCIIILKFSELHTSYFVLIPNIITQIKSRRMRWEEYVMRMGEDRKMYRVLMGKPEGKRSLGRSRRRWYDGIRTDLREIGWGRVEWIQLAHDRGRWPAIVHTVMDLRVLAPPVLVSRYHLPRSTSLSPGDRTIGPRPQF
jgi:hypothetical protein